MGCSFFVTKHVGVRRHDGRPRLLGDTGGLRRGFALVHQLLHGVCDALVTGQPRAERRKGEKCGRQSAIITVNVTVHYLSPALPFLEGLLSYSVLLRLSVLIEVGPQSLWILLVCRCQAQLKDSLIETH